MIQDTTVILPPSKINAEKKQREHLLQLNQILAQQVMQMSKIVAGKCTEKSDKENIFQAIPCAHLYFSYMWVYM